MSAVNINKKSKKRKHGNDIEECNNKSKVRRKGSVCIEEEPTVWLNKESSLKMSSEDENLDAINHKKNLNVETEETWSNEDYIELIRRMEAQIPKDDNKSFTNRVEKLDWNQIKFGPYSVEECREKWKVLRGKVRHFRLLGEVLGDAKTWVNCPWTAPLSKKKVRHPDQPPRPLSSFMLFYMAKKKKVMKRNPNLKLTDISRIVGEKYKALSEEKKAQYKEKARQMQEDYKLNLSKFYDKHPELMPVTKRQTKSNRPLPPFKIYLRSMLKKHESDEDLNQHEFSEKYKEAWKHLSYKKKAYWIRIAKEEEEKFLEKVNEDLLDDGESRPTTSYKSVISKEEHALLDRLAGKPKKPPNSAYSLFSRLMLQSKDDNHIDGEPKNRMKEIAIKWKEVPDEQKKEYAEEVKQMHENYKLDFANYLESLPEDKKAEEMAKIQPKKKIKQKLTKRSPAELAANNENLFNNEPEKPPMTPWDLFKNEFIKKNPHLTSKLAFTQAAEMWKNLSLKKIEKYKKKHEQMKEKYMADYQTFLGSLNEKELEQFSKMKKENGLEEVDEDEESLDEETSSDEDPTELTTNKDKLYKYEPEKPPVTAWDLFKNEFIKKNSQLSSKIAFTRAAEMWKTLTQQEMDKYKKKHEQLKEKYLVDYQTFLQSLNEEELKQYSKMKKENEKKGVEEESIDEETSSDEEEHDNPASASSSEESDSGVSEEEGF